jgi:hypothetical protein
MIPVRASFQAPRGTAVPQPSATVPTLGAATIQGTLDALAATGLCLWDAMVALVEAGTEPTALPLPDGFPCEAVRGFLGPVEAANHFDELAEAGDAKGAALGMNAYLTGRRVRRDLDLGNGYPWLTSLPAGLEVAEDLLLGRTAIPELPAGLSVGKDLYLTNSAFEAFGPGLRVGGDAFIRRCAAWDGQIPADAIIEGAVRTDRHPSGLLLANWRDLHPGGEHLSVRYAPPMGRRHEP